MSTTAQILQEFGFEQEEVSTYLAALELGPTSLLDLSQKTGINRTTLYGVSKRLIDRGLLTLTVKGKRKLYVAESPERFSQVLEKRLTRFQDLLPELLSLSRKGTVKPKMKYLEGLEGIKAAYQDSLHSKEKVLYAFVGVERLAVKSRALHAFWEKEFIDGRKKAGVKGMLIIPDNEEGRAFKTRDVESFRESRMVPAPPYNFDGEILLFDDVVTFISYNEKDEFALSLQSSAIAKTLRMIWRIVWNAAY